MIAANLTRTYHMLRAMGLVRNKADFSRLLGKGPRYLKNVEQRGQLTVPLAVSHTLRGRLSKIKELTPRQIGQHLGDVIAALDRDCHVAQALGWRR
jgi:hypothetical protein